MTTLLVAALLVVPFAAQREPAKPAAGTALIRGRVVAADSGQPLRRAQVRVSSSDFRDNRTVSTDAEGRYELAELPAGRYTLYARKVGYVERPFGQTRSSESARPLEIGAGQIIEKVDFALIRGAVITGRIVDELGDAVPDASVTLMQFRNTGGRRRLAPSARAATANDIGEFRMFGISPGQYYLSVTARSDYPPDLENRPSYAQTYFPGTTSAAEAQRLTIAAGQVITGLTLALVPARLARVSGMAIDSQGRPLSGWVEATERDRLGMFGGPGGSIRPDGTFTIIDVSPGSYTLQANGQSGGEFASADIDVAGDDLVDVRLVGAKPLSVTGRIVIDPAIAAPPRPALLQTFATPTQLDGFSTGPSNPTSPVKDDFTFDIKTRPGKMRLAMMGLPAGWELLAVRHRGFDVTDSGFDFKAGENLSGIEIELTNRVTTVAGLATNARGEAVKDYSVIVFAQDRDRWTFASRYIRAGRADLEGRFKVTGLPPGGYDAVALESLDGSAVHDPEFLDRIQQKATRFSLSDGETKTLDLKLSSAP